MIRDEEAEDVFQTLSSLLSEMKLSWVVDQVNEEIALGKLTSKRVRVRQSLERDSENLLLAGFASRTKSETFTRSIQYSPQERLALLVSGLRRATVDLVDIYAAAMGVNTFPDEGSIRRSHVNTVDFRSDENISTRKFTADEGRSALEKAKVLRNLLDELAEEI